LKFNPKTAGQNLRDVIRFRSRYPKTGIKVKPTNRFELLLDDLFCKDMIIMKK